MKVSPLATLTTLATVGLLAFSSTSFADNRQGFYAGGNWSFIDSNAADAAGNGVDFRSLEVVGGYKYRSWAGVEARFGTSLKKETFATDLTGGEVEVGIDHYESLYYRLESANQVAKFYVLLGFSNIQTSNGNSDESGSESGASYGVGIGFVMNENLNLNFEYRDILDEDATTFTAMSIGLDYRF
ncbi:porin family protein [Teredinibacter waterburyi]|jgi:hypothetical protein|uniref:porin family protein n=1 Tax=Teredinibacter waterburyi TaxID=1500538 RepID=UPI00165F8150|nr:porin family protein [Teredinibacter waterburyi]